MTTPRKSRWWLPAAVLVLGALLSLGIRQQRVMSLQAPLAVALPDSVEGMAGTAVDIPEEEARVAAFTDYALTVYEPESAAAGATPDRWVSVYMGYYDSQTRGRTIHSPRNCLPGSGWEALESGKQTLPLAGNVTVNRYMLQNGDEQAMVLYWYQGRGRVAHDEYRVKWDLFRDAALKRRTDEALVRIVVPIDDSPEAALETATRVATRLKPELDRVLPEG